VRAALALLGVVFLLPPPAGAVHGGVDRLSREAAGPYLLSAWTRPEPATTAGVLLSVAVMRPDGAPVLDAIVEVTAEPLAPSGTVVRLPATREASANRLYYAVELPVSTVGRWRIRVAANGAAGAGQANFEMSVARHDGPGIAVLVASAAAAIAALGWLARTRWGWRRRTPA
jgi:hypothetical protein